MILRVLKLNKKGPHGYRMVRVIGEGGPDDVNDVESEDIDGYIAELVEVAARAGHTIEIEDEQWLLRTGQPPSARRTR